MAFWVQNFDSIL